MTLINASTLPGRRLEGVGHGATVSLILNQSEPGDGPRLHRHPYDETWVVVGGQLSFHAGEEQIAAGPGDIVVVPAQMPHRFTNLGSGPCELVCIHASPTFVTEWLD